MPGGWVGPGAFDQCLVVPDPDATAAGQCRHHFPQLLIQHYFFYFIICLPEVEQLIEYLSVVITLFINAIIFSGLRIAVGHLSSIALFYCLGNGYTPGG